MQFLSWIKFVIIIIFILMFIIGTIQSFHKEKKVCFILCIIELILFGLGFLIYVFYFNIVGDIESIVEIDNKKMIRETHNTLFGKELKYYDYQNVFIRSKQIKIYESYEEGEFLYKVYYDNFGNIIKKIESDNNDVIIDDSELVKIKDYIKDIIIDLKYASKDNFTNQIIYEENEAYLRYGTVKKLMKVQNDLKEKGYKLVIWDAYRSVENQFKLWNAYPDANYVSNPNIGYSSHSRGNTVDITITTIDNEMVEMPSDFDDFSKLADRDYSDVSEFKKNNALILEEIMQDNGFKEYKNEWWHYTDEIEYNVIKESE